MAITIQQDPLLNSFTREPEVNADAATAKRSTTASRLHLLDMPDAGGALVPVARPPDVPHIGVDGLAAQRAGGAVGHLPRCHRPELPPTGERTPGPPQPRLSLRAASPRGRPGRRRGGPRGPGRRRLGAGGVVNSKAEAWDQSEAYHLSTYSLSLSLSTENCLYSPLLMCWPQC